MSCRICGNAEGNSTFEAREMMFGFRDRFTYSQCGRCECLQIAEPPKDLGRYYPDHYYSTSESSSVPSPGVPDWCLTMVGGPVLSLLSLPSDAAEGLEGYLLGRVVSFYLEGLSLTHASRILDVGCGRGGLLLALQSAGYSNLLGVDRYLEDSIEHEGGLRILKGTLADVEPRPEWDLIMLHHSFEHLDDPLETLQRAARLLSPQGTCLIRTPVVPSHAWRRYGTDWVGLDAPRHMFIHSKRSMELLAQAAGLRLDRVLYDSTSLQFLASDLYSRDVPMYSEEFFNAFTGGPPAGDASPDAPSGRAEMSALERRAEELNAQGEGDQAAFYLQLLPTA